MTRISRIYNVLASVELFLCSAAVLLFWGCMGAFVLQTGLRGFFELVPSKALAVLLVVNRALALWGDVRNRKRMIALDIGVLVILGGAAWNYAAGFEGVVGLGEGEDFAHYDRVEKGYFARPRAFPALVGKFEGDVFALHE